MDKGVWGVRGLYRRIEELISLISLILRAVPSVSIFNLFLISSVFLLRNSIVFRYESIACR